MESYCLTNKGLKRNDNQDFVYASDTKVGALDGLLIVADGMGGHAAGDIASRLCVETMLDFIKSTKEHGAVNVLSGAIRRANRAVVEKASTNTELFGMGTTLVAASPERGNLFIANVGDSRLYIIDDDRIEQITHDHSLVEELISAGRLERDQIRNYPQRNIITRAIGAEKDPEVDFFDVSLNKGDIALLCSDGLTNMIEDERIFRIVCSSGSLSDAARGLVSSANRAGGIDNISVVLARF